MNDEISKCRQAHQELEIKCDDQLIEIIKLKEQIQWKNKIILDQSSQV